MGIEIMEKLLELKKNLNTAEESERGIIFITCICYIIRANAKNK